MPPQPLAKPVEGVGRSPAQRPGGRSQVEICRVTENLMGAAVPLLRNRELNSVP